MIAARILTAYYFLHFLIILPLLGLIETPKPLPHSISEAVLKQGRRPAPPLLLHRRSALRRSRPAGARRSAAEGTPHPPRQKWSFAGPFGQLRPGAAAARLQGLQGSLPDLSRAEPAVVPQSRRAGRPGILAGAGAKRSPPSTRCRTARTTRARCSSATAGSPTVSRRRSRTSRRARTLYNGDGAARPVGDRQGAHLRARLSLVPHRCCRSRSTRSTASTTSRRCCKATRTAAGRRHAARRAELQQILPRPFDRDAAAADRRPRRLHRRQRRRRSTNIPRTSPPS